MSRWAIRAPASIELPRNFQAVQALKMSSKQSKQSKTVLAAIKARQIKKRETKMARRAAAKAASKTAARSQARKMELLNDTLMTAWFPGYKAKTCEWCGAKGSTTEIFCDCEWIIERFGAVSCKECDIFYGSFPSHLEYLELWGTGYTDSFYFDEMCRCMKKPCKSCSAIYQTEYDSKLAAFMTWSWRWESMSDDYDDRCTSGRGAPCRCCGD